MNFLVNTKVLYEHLSLSESVILKNPMIPVIANYLFDIQDGQLKATVTDLQLTCITSISVDAKENGQMAVPANIFLRTLQELPEEVITISFDQESYNITIKASTGEYSISSENPEDFPRLPEIENGFELNIPREALHKALSQCAYAMSTDELRPAMNGIYFSIHANGTEIVSTDGHRLVLNRLRTLHHDPSHQLIIPSKTVSMLERVLKKRQIENLKLTFNTSHARFEIDDMVISCRLIDEQYPDYERVIPKDNNNHVIVHREDMRASLSRISIYANKSTYQMRLDLKGESMTLTAEDQEFSNQAQETLSCTHNGPDIRMGFDSRFLREALDHMSTQRVRFELSEPGKAALAIPIEDNEADGNEQATEPENLALVMPIMLNEEE